MSKLSLFLALCSVLACAQETPSAAQQTAPSTTEAAKKATVEGVVVNEITKEPIRRVEINLQKQGRGGNPYSGVTDAAGKFKIENIDAGDYYVVLRKGGFLMSRNYYGMSGRVLKLTAGASLTGLRFSMQPQGIVTGRVLDDEGEPVQNVFVMLLRYRYDRGSYRAIYGGRPQQTNDRGEFRFTEVQSGKYYLLADVRRMQAIGVSPPLAAGTPRTALVATYFPSAPEFAQAAGIEVQPGQELSNRDIALRKEKVVKVTGKVLDASGAPARQAMVSFTLADGAGANTGVTAMVDDKGAFAADKVPPGQYNARAFKFNGQENEQSAAVPAGVGDAGLEGVVLQLQPPLEAKGAFVLEGSDRKDFDFAGSSLNLQPADDTSYPVAYAQPKTDGTFTMTGITPGRFTVSVYTGSGEGYVKAILLGSEDVYGKEVEGAAVAAAGLKVVMRVDGATLSGTVEIPEERKAALRSPAVVLMTTDARLSKSEGRNVAQLNQNNGYELKNLRPGEYIAFAFEEYDYPSLQDPEVLAAIASKGTKVTLAANDSKSIDLKILPWPEQFADRIQ
ncbi:MAG: carboxypeptidase regulatory-like domain-containing protein [Bryobacteraceae bacterium]|jgi:protocatechuate 3,4-dioxygenase beta subunit